MIALETARFVWQIDDQCQSHAFIDAASGANMLASGKSTPWCRIVREGKELLPIAIAYKHGQLMIQFAGAGEVCLSVKNAKDHLVLRVELVTDESFDRLIFMDVPLRAGAAASDAFVACAVALNTKTRVDELPGPQQRLTAQCYPRFGVNGAAVAIVGCPFHHLRGILKTVVKDAPGLPHSPLGGPWALDAPENFTSYLFGVATEETVDDWIELCHGFGVQQLHFDGGFRLGDYVPDVKRFPDGMTSARNVIDRLHKAGLKAGMHTYSFSIDQRSPYVTPVPDKRLARESTYTLAGDISEAAMDIPLVEDTTGLPKAVSYLVRRSMCLQIDDELVEYTAVRDHSPYAVCGCRRGAWGTRATSHARGAAVCHLRACWGLFAPDGESSLFGEVAGNIANTVNECGFDMIYLDGLDGIHILGGEEGRWHYGGRFAFEVFNRLQRPVIMEMAAFLHHLWFVRSRMGAWDHPSRGYRAFLDHHIRSNEQCARIFLPAHLGWWKPRVSAPEECATNAVAMMENLACKNETTFAEDVEYLCAKALGTGVGFSLQGLSPQSVNTTPHLRRLGDTFRRYARARRSGTVSSAIAAKLREPEAEYSLEECPGGRFAFRQVQRLTHIVSGRDDGSSFWNAINPYNKQPVKVRIEALWSAAPYNDPNGITLTDFKTSGEFNADSVVTRILNSGKIYSFPSAAPGMQAWLEPSKEASPAGDGIRTARFRATSQGGARFPSSSPNDSFSLLDHGERSYQERPVSWVWMGKKFSAELNLLQCPAYGLWMRGDNSNVVLNVQIADAESLQETEDHYVPLDFSGWRYVELVEPESDRFEQFSWPYAREVYSIYRSSLKFDRIAGINLWLNNVPSGAGACCLISQIRALPLVKTVLRKPTLSIGGKDVKLPFELDAGAYIEATPDGVVTSYKQNGTILESVDLPDGPIRLDSGLNRLGFTAQAIAGCCRARVTVMVLDV